MVRILAFIILSIASMITSLASKAATTHNFCPSFKFPIEQMICFDPTISILDDEMAHLYFRYRDTLRDSDKQALTEEQFKFLDSRLSACDVPARGGISAQNALQSRDCLIDLYRKRIAELADKAPNPDNRLNDTPDEVVVDSAYFTFVSISESRDAAQAEMDRLQKSFPYEAFDLYPPYGDQTWWGVAFAGYTDQASANEARDIAIALNINSSPAVWRLPDPLEQAHFWRAIRDDEPEQATGQAKTVVDCYSKLSASNQVATVEGVYECSGVWVTPRALMLCTIGATCPVQPDTVEGRAIIRQNLADEKLSIDSVLVLDPANLPHVPNAAVIQQCNGSSKTVDEFNTCTSFQISDQYNEVLKCFNAFTDGEKLSCFSDLSKSNDLKSLVGCLAGGKPSAIKIVDCAATPKQKQQVEALRGCVASAQADETTACITDAMPRADKEVANCLVNSPADVTGCFDSVSPQAHTSHQVTVCLQSSDSATAVACVASATGGNAGRIANCLTGSNATDAGLCILGNTPQTRAIQKVSNCVQNGRDAASVVASCTDGLLDDKSRQAIACVANAGDDRAKLASCAAGAVLPPEAARLVGCASDSDGPTSFALCAAGPAMNEEWRIAAECAIESGGNPVGFAGCTAGRLTIRELTKCFSGQVGKDCFGPNNTIVKGLNDAFHDITQGPGKNNEIVKALGVLASATGGPNSMVNNPGQIWGGSNSVFNHPAQIWGGNNSVFNNPSELLPHF